MEHDPRIAASEVLELAAQHGVTVYRRGTLWHLQGPTMDLLVSDRRALTPADFLTFPESIAQRTRFTSMGRQ